MRPEIIASQCVSFLKQQNMIQQQQQHKGTLQKMNTTELQKLRMDGELALGMRAENQRQTFTDSGSPTKNIMINGILSNILNLFECLIFIKY